MASVIIKPTAALVARQIVTTVVVVVAPTSMTGVIMSSIVRVAAFVSVDPRMGCVFSTRVPTI